MRCNMNLFVTSHANTVHCTNISTLLQAQDTYNSQNVENHGEHHDVLLVHTYTAEPV